MKKKQTIAIILASAMMFSLIGCSSPSKVIEGSEGMETYSDEPDDGAETFSDELDDGAETFSDELDDGAVSLSPDANTGSGKNCESSDELADSTVNFRGKDVSVLNDPERTLNELGKPEEIDDEFSKESPTNYWDKKNFGYRAYTINGKTLPYYMSVCEPGIPTSRNVSVGDPKENVVAAYGDPTEDYGEYVEYKFNSFTLGIGYANGKVEYFAFTNNSADEQVTEYEKTR